jgi:hypothetical protein
MVYAAVRFVELWYKGWYLGGSGFLTRGRGELIPLFPRTTAPVK